MASVFAVVELVKAAIHETKVVVSDWSRFNSAWEISTDPDSARRETGTVGGSAGAAEPFNADSNHALTNPL